MLDPTVSVQYFGNRVTAGITSAVSATELLIPRSSRYPVPRRDWQLATDNCSA